MCCHVTGLAYSASPLPQAPVARTEEVAAATQSDGEFALDLYRQLASEESGKSLFFSPYSVASALGIALALFGLLGASGLCTLAASICAENISKGFQADAREELYLSLLAKSQTFHGRQRVGDIMARATDDTQMLSMMVVPGSNLIIESSLAIVVPCAFLAGIEPTERRILVVKSSQHFRAAFGPIAGDILVVDGGGLTTRDYSRMPFRRLRRPIAEFL